MNLLSLSTNRVIAKWLTLKFVLASFLIISLSANLDFDKKHTVISKNYYDADQELIVDNQPIKDNRTLYALCNATEDRQSLSCDLVMKIFREELETKTCRLKIKANRNIQEGQYQLKILFRNRVIFMWLDQDRNKSTAQQSLYFRTIDMESCRYRENKVTREVTDQEYSGIDSFHVVSYKNDPPTFSVYYRNDKMCQDKLCGTLHLEDGQRLLGPTQSFIPTNLFKETSFLSPAKPGSSLDGHFVFSPTNIWLVTSEVKEVVNPRGFDAQAVSDDAGQVGFCYQSRLQIRRIECFQFDSQGNNVTRHSIDLDYTPGVIMAVQNLARRGEMLLVTDKCEDADWCTRNYGLVPFHAIKLRPNGRHEVYQLFRDVDCNHAQDIRMEVRVVNDHGSGNGVCVIFVCYAIGEGRDRGFVNVIQKCV